MNKKRDYKKIIKEIERSKLEIIVLDQKMANRIMGNDFPKSLFNNNYIRNGSNELARYIMKNLEEYDYEVVEPKIILRRRSKS